MSEIEQLRNEVNELRERLAKLESARAPMALGNPPRYPLAAQPTWVNGVYPVGGTNCNHKYGADF